MNVETLIISIIMIFAGIVGVWLWLTDKEIPSWIKAIGLVIGGPLVMIGAYLLLYSFVYGRGYYEYNTFNGEIGTSWYCHQERGSLICLTNGGAGEITVESFRWLRSENE